MKHPLPPLDEDNMDNFSRVFFEYLAFYMDFKTQCLFDYTVRVCLDYFVTPHNEIASDTLKLCEYYKHLDNSKLAVLESIVS